MFFLVSLTPSYGFKFDFQNDFRLNENLNNHSKNDSDALININFGFLGYKDYEKRKNYSDNCFSYHCTNIGINVKINLPTGYILQ